VKAATHTEVYRRYTGTLTAHRLRFWPLGRAGIRTAAKKKLPLVLLLAPPAIATIIFAFAVYTRFALQAGVTPTPFGGAQTSVASVLGSTMMANAAQQMIQVRDQIIACLVSTSLFSLLLISWYGAGLFAEDRRLGAHLLYFARPLTRLDYVLSKLVVVMFFGALGGLLPGLVICLVATFASPEWSFFTQEYDVIGATVLVGVLWVTLISSIVLAVSSLSSRRTFALLGAFAYFMLTFGIASLLAQLQKDDDFMDVSPVLASVRIAGALLQLRDAPQSSLPLAILSVTANIVIAWIVTWTRVKRLEVVA